MSENTRKGSRDRGGAHRSPAARLGLGRGRARIVAWIVAVTGMGLTILVLGASFALRANMASGISIALDQEAGEVHRFSAEAVDPDTGRPFATAHDFITTYIARQQPAPDEILVGSSLASSADGAPPTARSGRSAPRFDALDAEAQQAVSQPSSSGTLATAAHGRISWHNVEVRAPDGRGYVAVVEMHQGRENELLRQIGLLAFLALCSLMATGLAAWLVSGRIRMPIEHFEQLALEAADRPGLTRLPERGGGDELRLARAANALTRSAEQAVEREQQFSDDLTHGVRTPLAIVRGTLEQPGATAEQQAISRDRAIGELHHLEGLIDSLVLLGRADRPDFFQVVEGVDVDAFTQAFVAAWAQELTDEGGDRDGDGVGDSVGDRAYVVVGETAAVVAALDEPRLAQALDELVANALDASAPGGTVTVSSQVTVDAAAAQLPASGDGAAAGAGTESEARVVSFFVTDTGRGVPEREYELVSERFARASNDPDPGEGLGLAVAAKLAEGMGGRLTLSPGPDGGTTARLDVPSAVPLTRSAD